MVTTAGETPPSSPDDLFVGREAELGQIAAAADEVAAGRGRLVLLTGEPGIGKTRLCDRAVAAAAARGLIVAWGRCWEAGGAPAYWPWLEVLGALARMLDMDGGAVAARLGEGAPLLAELVPELRARLPEAPAGAAPPADEARFRLFRAALALVREAAGAARAGIAVVLDDVHAADRSSLLLLHFLARELRSLRVLLLCTCRDVEARLDAETSDLVSRIGREGLTLPLRRLDRTAAASLVRRRAGALEPDVEARIVDSAQGNPLFLDEMLRLLDEQGEGAVAAGVVPPGVREVIRHRLARVAGPARGLLDLAAVAGDEVDLGLLVAASGRDALAVGAELEEATRVGVLAVGSSGAAGGGAGAGRGTGRGGRRRFGHALVREVLYRDLDEERRRALHGRVAEALERLARPGGAEGAGAALPHAEIAHHALEGPPEMLAGAVDHAMRAAERAQALLAYDDAIATLERAARALAAAGNPPAPLARLLVALGEARIRRGDTPEGQACCRQASTLARALGDAELGARAALTYGRAFTFGVVDPVLVGMLEEALEALPPGDSAQRARLLARLGAAMQPSQNSAEPMRLAREAIATARRLGDKATLLEALHDGISALMDIAPPAEHRALSLEAEALAMELGDRERLLRTHGRLALAHLATGDLGATDARVAAYGALAAELRAPWVLWRGLLLRAVRATMAGRFAESEALGAEALRSGKGASDPAVERVWATNHEALLRAAERHDEMVAFDPVVRRTRGTYSLGGAWQASGTALTYARLEDAQQARAYLDLLPEFFRPPVDNLFAIFFVAEVAAVCGPPDLAARLYRQICALPDEYVVLGMSYFSWEGPSARLRGLLAAFLERWDEAAVAFEDAISRCRLLGARPYLARTEYEYGRALLARGAPGDAARARALVASARAAAVELEMPGLVRLADARLAAIAAAPPATADAPAAAAAGSAGPAPAADAEALPFTFALEGEYWTFCHEGATFRLKDSLGLQYLTRLFREPGREIHVLDLAGAHGGVDEVVDTGDAGELLDETARAEYKRRLEDLRETAAEAEAFGDGARAARAREEIELLAAELGRAVGLGGRARRAGAAAERARSAVQRRIKNAIERIGEHAPALAVYLGRAVRTGNFCMFRRPPDRS